MTSLFSLAASLEQARQPFVEVTITDTGGSTPQLVGARMLVTADAFHGTVGGGAFEHAVLARGRALLGDPLRETDRLEVHLVRDLGMCCGGKMTAFLSKHAPVPRLYVFGAGHVGTALCRVAALAGFEVHVVDARAEWTAASRFPEGVTVHDAEPEDFVRATPPGAHDAAVVMTHSHPLDEALIRLLAPAALAFLGLIGSRGKWARFRARLVERGISDQALECVRCPVGLAIGAATPEEIAVSIVAELIRARRVKT